MKKKFTMSRTIVFMQLYKKGLSILIILIMGLTTNAQVYHDLVLDMDFQNSLLDSSASNHTTSMSGTVAYGSDNWSNANSAISFSGDSNPGQVSLTNVTANYKVSFPSTFSFWVKLNSYNSVDSPIITTEENTSTIYTGFFIAIGPTGSVQANFGDGGPAGPTSRRSWTTASGIVPINEWTHIAVVFNSTSNAVIYVNGFETSTTTSGTGGALAYNFVISGEGKIGSYIKGLSTRTTDGFIDKLKIYGTSLTQSEILALYYTSFPNISTLLLNFNMNNGHTDNSIYNNPVTQIGNCTYESDRNSNPSSALDASLNSAVEFTDPSGIYKCNFPITFSVWVNPDDLNGYYPIFTNDEDQTIYSGFWVQTNPGGYVSVSIGNGFFGPSGRKSYQTSTVLQAGQWQMITITMTAASSPTWFVPQIYFNGVQQPLDAPTGSAGSGMYYNTTTGSGAKIGAAYKGTTTLTAFNGLIDDVMMWNEILSQDQITSLYTNYVNNTDNTFNSIDDLGENETLVQLFPNPSSGSLSIKSNFEFQQIEIYSTAGKLISDYSFNSGQFETTIDSQINQGIYLIKISGAMGSALKRFVKL